MNNEGMSDGGGDMDFSGFSLVDDASGVDDQGDAPVTAEGGAQTGDGGAGGGPEASGVMAEYAKAMGIDASQAAAHMAASQQGVQHQNGVGVQPVDYAGLPGTMQQQHVPGGRVDPNAQQNQQMAQAAQKITALTDDQVNAILEIGGDAMKPMVEAIRGIQTFMQEATGTLEHMQEFQKAVFEANQHNVINEVNKFVDDRVGALPALQDIYGGQENRTPQQEQARTFLRNYAGNLQSQAIASGKNMTNQQAMWQALSHMHNLTQMEAAKKHATKELQSTLTKRQQAMDVQPGGSTRASPTTAAEQQQQDSARSSIRQYLAHSRR